MTRAERDIAIARAFRDGARRTHLADVFGLTPRRISQIAAAHGVNRYPANQRELGLYRGGRPRDVTLDPVRYDPHYCKLRRVMGAAYARAAFGIAAGEPPKVGKTASFSHASQNDAVNGCPRNFRGAA